MTHLKTKLAEYGIILDKDKFLMLRFSREANVSEKWIFPGGRMDISDTPTMALKREVKEETKLKVKILNPVDVAMWGKGEDERYAIFFLCKLINGDVKLSKEHQEFKWYKFSEIDNIEFHDKSFKSILKSLKKDLKV